MININTNIIDKVTKHYGELMQNIICMEECSELAQAISKVLRGRDTYNLVEEIADVYICLEQLKMLHDISDNDIQKVIDYKQQRTLRRVTHSE